LIAGAAWRIGSLCVISIESNNIFAISQFFPTLGRYAARNIEEFPNILFKPLIISSIFMLIDRR
jgi:hypothetical protein